MSNEILNQFKQEDLFNAVWGKLLGNQGLDIRTGRIEFERGDTDGWVSSTDSGMMVEVNSNELTVTFHDEWITWGEVFFTIKQPTGARLFPTLTSNGIVGNLFKFVFKKADGTNETIANVPDATFVNFIVVGKANPLE